jgi:hypothetical protein
MDSKNFSAFTNSNTLYLAIIAVVSFIEESRVDIKTFVYASSFQLLSSLLCCKSRSRASLASSLRKLPWLDFRRTHSYHRFILNIVVSFPVDIDQKFRCALLVPKCMAHSVVPRFNLNHSGRRGKVQTILFLDIRFYNGDCERVKNSALYKEISKMDV